MVITGKRWVRWRNISNEAEPEPIIIPALNSITGTDVVASSLPVFALELKCLELFASLLIPPK